MSRIKSFYKDKELGLLTIVHGYDPGTDSWFLQAFDNQDDCLIDISTDRMCVIVPIGDKYEYSNEDIALIMSQLEVDQKYVNYVKNKVAYNDNGEIIERSNTVVPGVAEGFYAPGIENFLKKLRQ